MKIAPQHQVKHVITLTIPDATVKQCFVSERKSPITNAFASKENFATTRY